MAKASSSPPAGLVCQGKGPVQAVALAPYLKTWPTWGYQKNSFESKLSKLGHLPRAHFPALPICLWLWNLNPNFDTTNVVSKSPSKTHVSAGGTRFQTAASTVCHCASPGRRPSSRRRSPAFRREFFAKFSGMVCLLLIVPWFNQQMQIQGPKHGGFNRHPTTAPTAPGFQELWPGPVVATPRPGAILWDRDPR